MRSFFIFFGIRIFIVLSIFGVFRIIHLILYPWYWESLSAQNIAMNMLAGMRFDVSVIAKVIILFDIVFLLLGNLTRHKILYYVFAALSTVGMVGIVYVESVSLFTFPIFGRHITFELHEFYDNFNAIMREAVTARAYVFFPFVLFLLAIGAMWQMIWRAFYPISFTKYRYSAMVATALLFVGVIAGRGGVQEKPIVESFAFAGHNSQSGYQRLNSVFTWLHYIARPAVVRYDFMNDREAKKTVREITDTVSTRSDVAHPFLKTVTHSNKQPAQPYNFVFLIMESWNAKATGALSSQNEFLEYLRKKAPKNKQSHLFDGIQKDHPLFTTLTPEFDALANEGVLFQKFYASGSNSAQGIMAIVSSLPPLDNIHFVNSGFVQNNFDTINRILMPEYTGLFLTGLFDGSGNNDRFMKLAGIDRIIQKSAFENSDTISDSWGIFDEQSLDRLHTELVKTPQPFFAYYISITTHTPYTLPDDSFKIVPETIPMYEYLNELYYADYALGRFMRQEKKSAHFGNTVYFITADHTNYVSVEDTVDYARIPLLIYAPGIFTTPAVIDDYGSQIDILPTVADITGYGESFVTAGMSLFEKKADRFVYNYNGNGYRWFYKGIGIDFSKNMRSYRAYTLANPKNALTLSKDAQIYERYFKSYLQLLNNSMLENSFMPKN